MNEEGRFLIIRGSHMKRMVNFMPSNSVSLAVSGFVASPRLVLDILRQLAWYAPIANDTAVMDLLSNSSYIGIDKAGATLQFPGR
jgi:hypothetical protein